ncbi:dihydrolipoamide acetyltransferase family protein [Brevibacillus choshinensis]|uniref:dihydrolipoamide acetyltransferase family protein n=1 Tax=Brevibacillus choshinensis TaxID=54911 RepID=UPI002E1C23CA|nr:dihydrolipoamide acetyltransferase family protein [Brevibacillus choshinensis]MED4779837.1 dihydrolipoamide acetyltransferase family protein [Brevibacillus choshinensis]
MATAVFMPKLSMTMETGTVIQWFKQEGDLVREGDILLEVLTDKINIEVESYSTGTLLKIYYGPDQVVPVNQVIGYVGEASEVVPDTAPSAEPHSSTEATEVQNEQKENHETRERESVGQKIRATPVARRIAKDNGIDLSQVNGTGPNGRVQKVDIEQAVAARSSKPISTQPVTTTEPRSRKVKVEGMRKVIAERMAASAYTAPHVTLSTEADMSQVMEVRSTLLPTIEKMTGYRLSYTEIIMKAVATALSRHPKVNASLKDDVIELHETINIGLAVAVTDGLFVPVIKQADRKGLADLTTETKRVAGLARDGRLLPDDMRGGTFTISNLGMYAIDVFTPIINQPESAILGVGRIHEKPVGVNGQIVLRPMMSLSLSFDHRVMDGAPAAAFLQEIKELLELPYHLLA